MENKVSTQKFMYSYSCYNVMPLNYPIRRICPQICFFIILICPLKKNVNMFCCLLTEYLDPVAHKNIAFMVVKISGLQ